MPVRGAEKCAPPRYITSQFIGSIKNRPGFLVGGFLNQVKPIEFDPIDFFNYSLLV